MSPFDFRLRQDMPCPCIPIISSDKVLQNILLMQHLE